MIRLFVIEDHPVIVTGLKNTFRPSRDEIEVAGSASSVDEALLKADAMDFDIFLLDLWIPNAHPQLNVKRIKDNFKGKPIVIFTRIGLVFAVRQAMEVSNFDEFC